MGPSDRIRSAMKDASIDSAAEVGRRARPPVNAVTMRAYVSKGANARNPPLDVCNAIGKVLGVMGQWLFDGKGPRRPPPPAPPRDTTITHVPLLDSVTAADADKNREQAIHLC